MPTWKETRRETVDGIEFVTQERMDRRNRQGATEYILQAYRNGEMLKSQRIAWNVWLGHNYGRIIKDDWLKQLKHIEIYSDAFDIVRPIWLSSRPNRILTRVCLYLCANYLYRKGKCTKGFIEQNGWLNVIQETD